MTRRLVALLCALAALLALVAAGTASAARARAFYIAEAASSFPERAYVLSLPERMHLRSGQVRVLENGQPVPDLSIVASGSTTSTKQFGAVLVIDASQSMEGKPELAALAAARAFAAKRRPNEQLAVITYNVAPHVVQGFTTDGAKIDAALSKTPLFNFGTHISDAVVAALDLIKEAHITAGSVVVLSDGQEHRGYHDKAKHETERSAAKAARAAHVRVFTVALRSRFFDPKTLRNLAADTGGTYSEAISPAQLRAIYSSLGRKLAREYVIRYVSPAGPGLHIKVAVRVRGLKGVATSAYVTPKLPVHRAAKPKPYHESFLHRLFTSPLMTLFVALLASTLFALSIVAFTSGWRRGTFRSRMAEFVSLPTPEKERPSGVLADKIEGGTEKMFERAGWWGRFVADLQLADISTPPERIVLFTFIGTFLTIWLLSVIIHSLIISLLVGICIPFVVRAWISRKVDRKRRLFGEQLPDNLQVLASALRAGHSFIGALSVVVDDAPEPSRTEFRRVVADEQLGVPLEDALHVVVERMESRELEQVALVASLQRQTGGNTAEVLDRVTDTIRERFELRRTVRTLTAQGRLSRWVVSLLPVFLLLVISLLNPKYMHPLYGTTAGRIALGFAAAMVVSGSLVIKRIINIKV
jgi:tight adherence protein B